MERDTTASLVIGALLVVLHVCGDTCSCEFKFISTQGPILHMYIHTYIFLWGRGGRVEGEVWGTRCPGVVDILSPYHTWDGLQLIPISMPTNCAFVFALIWEEVRRGGFEEWCF